VKRFYGIGEWAGYFVRCEGPLHDGSTRERWRLMFGSEDLGWAALPAGTSPAKAWERLTGEKIE
jgi:hypothetical protein